MVADQKSIREFAALTDARIVEVDGEIHVVDNQGHFDLIWREGKLYTSTGKPLDEVVSEIEQALMSFAEMMTQAMHPVMNMLTSFAELVENMLGVREED